MGKISNLQRSHQGTTITLTVDFSVETLQAGRVQNDIFKVWKDKVFLAGNFHLAELSFRYDGEVKALSDK